MKPKPDRGPWIQTFTGRQFFPLDPDPLEIDIEDIAHALALQCRFGGHSRAFYSVAQHSVFVADMCPPHLKLTGLLHDATEAYLIDLPRPIKQAIPEYRRIEDKLAEVIAKRFTPHPTCPIQFHHPFIKVADKIALATEARDLLGKPPAPWGDGVDPSPVHIEPWDSLKSEYEFLRRFRECTKP
ncbi:hypothetical protein OpiT1DRAFT_05665 [Opitutaceae bacterium TAV1]|nr:hypothetical protein OpiT1DRAFT_05665 [Opitutaceae bacterium TAV1]